MLNKGLCQEFQQTIQLFTKGAVVCTKLWSASMYTFIIGFFEKASALLCWLALLNYSPNSIIFVVCP